MTVGPPEPDRYTRERDPFFLAASNDPDFCRRYDIESWQRLGSGGAGSVVRIFSKLRREYVAVKLIHEVRPETQHKIAAEVRVADKVISPSVVRVYGPQESERLLWIEMEFVDGPTLRAHIDQLRRERKQMTFGEAAELCLAVTQGVTAIHAAGVVHRDLKPQNIILPAAGQAKAKIADFGISRFRDEERSTRTTEFRGTPQYAPPEFFTAREKSDEPGKPRPLTPEADVYSLGIVLYETLSGGHFPYPLPDGAESDSYQVVAAHLHGVPTPIRRHQPDVPAEVEQLLLGMLSKKPKERPSLREVDEVLARSLRGPSVPMPVRKTPPRIVPLAIGGAGLLALAAAVALLRGSGSPAAPAVETPAPAMVPASATAEPEETGFTVSLVDGGVVLTNQSGAAGSDTEITLVATDGRRYQAGPQDQLEPGSTLMIPLLLFTPQIADGTRLQRADVIVQTPSGRRSFSVPLQ